MAQEIQFTATSGVNAYVVLIDSTGGWYNNNAPPFEPFNAANWADYAITATEFGTSGIYAADLPGGLNAGAYSIAAYRRAGGSPAITDQPPISAGEINWNGTSIMPVVQLADGVTHGGGSAALNLSSLTVAGLVLLENDLSIQGSLNVAQNVFVEGANQIPWNADWDAEVQSECADAITAANLPTAAQIATAWGSSIIGNGRTRDYFLQGGHNRIDFAADGLSYTVYQTDDTTPLKAGVSTRLSTSVGPLRSVDPT